MKLVILAGGLGTRISEETEFIPKPMVKIGQKPIIWHIMKYYSLFGVNDFIICGGYKMHKIDQFFLKNSNKKNWNVKVINTGKNSNTGERLFRVKNYLKNEKIFFLTYGDGLSSINLNTLKKFHILNNATITVSAVKPPPRFGKLKIINKKIKHFYEKNSSAEDWISGGFFVCNFSIFSFFKKNNPIFEKDIIPKIVIKKKAFVFKHYGFWHPMDTMQEKRNLNKLWKSGAAPWRIW
ncbi:sugar phosphate nucleotidyltransferase [Candidatus Pelagibacter sp.]|nr:sugar phosphate nucleotidyltransferase [Candidatus Pelagibacter sp.]MDC1069926.1 sugar phosphate nucleotidyltransferase [Candidatus Pelagibacter sp.]